MRLSEIDVRRQVRQDIYKEFEIVLHSVLANLYPAISKMLEESGVFPSLEDLREAMQRSMRRSAPKARPEPTQNYQELEGAGSRSGDGRRRHLDGAARLHTIRSRRRKVVLPRSTRPRVNC